MILSFVKKKTNHFFLVCYYKFNKQQKKKFKKNFFDKTQNHDLFISPKRENAVLEMSLKSSIMSKLDHHMSKI